MKKCFSGFIKVSFLIFIVSFLIYLLCLSSSQIADFVNGTVSVGIRFILSTLSYSLPFSIFEALIILSIPMLILTVVILLRRIGGKADMLRGVLSLLAVISIIVTAYIYTLGVGYRTTSLSERIGVEEDTDLTADELYSTLTAVISEVNSLADRVMLTDGQTRMQYSVNEMSGKLIHAYDIMNEKYSLLRNYTSRVKPVYFSTVMSDLGITGIYSFFTGEANVNIEYPDYYIPFTSAHELAHQRGISRENEANFVAFLVCISSDDEYIRYSGYLNMYEYLSYALYSTDRQLYNDALGTLSPVAISDMRAADAVYQKHKDSPLGRINEKLNDAYLKANGTEGVVSYGYVVRLAVGYYQKQNNG